MNNQNKELKKAGLKATLPRIKIMEVDKGSDNKITVVIYEMLGTALFLYGILVSRGQELAVPLTLFA